MILLAKYIFFPFQLSNEIIRRCCREINLEKIFDGYIQSGMKSLHECIECCEQWKEIYNRVGLQYSFILHQIAYVIQEVQHYLQDRSTLMTWP